MSQRHVDELILRSLQGEASDMEARALQEWRRASPENERYFEELSRVWTLTGHAEVARASPAPPAGALIARAARRRIFVGGLAGAARLSRVAAAVALVVGLGAAGIALTLRPTPTFGATEFVTGRSEMVTARLSDGSVVRLAPLSRLRVTEDADSREVWLDGRAFFAVAHQEDRPFTVRTRAGDALALGTRFDLEVRGDDLQLVVVEGRVALDAGRSAPVEVGAGQVSRVLGGGAPSAAADEDVRTLLGWMRGVLVFQATPLDQVAREVEQRYRVRVQLADSSLAERTVTAWFTEEEVEEVLTVICRVVDAHCSRRGSVVSIEP